MALHRPHELRQQFHEPVAGRRGRRARRSGCPPPSYDEYNARIPGYSYLDLTAVWHVLKNLELRAGVTNLLDKDPPLIPSGDIRATADRPTPIRRMTIWVDSCSLRSRPSFSPLIRGERLQGGPLRIPANPLIARGVSATCDRRTIVVCSLLEHVADASDRQDHPIGAAESSTRTPFRCCSTLRDRNPQDLGAGVDQSARACSAWCWIPVPATGVSRPRLPRRLGIPPRSVATGMVARRHV